MADIAVVAQSVETNLMETAKQAKALAIGLQNVAPGEKGASPNKSVQYLLEIAQAIDETVERLRALRDTSSARG